MRALDLFCGGGGATIGILRAGFDEVVGVDNNPRHARIYPGKFVCADATNPPFDLGDSTARSIRT